MTGDAAQVHIAIPALWWVVDRAGRVVSPGCVDRDEALFALERITAELRAELEQLGHGRRAVTRQLNGYGIGLAPQGASFRSHTGGARARAGDRVTIDGPPVPRRRAETRRRKGGVPASRFPTVESRPGQGSAPLDRPTQDLQRSVPPQAPQRATTPAGPS